MKNTDTRPISAAMLAVLELDENEPAPIAGNIAARAINAVHGSTGDPFAGMGYGWADESPDLLDFVVGLVESADDAAADAADAAVSLADYDWHETADSAVPIYNAQAIACWGRLWTLIDESEVNELASPDAETLDRQRVGLYVFAREMLERLAGKLADEYENRADA